MAHDDESASRSAGTRPFSFPEFLERLHAALAAAGNTGAPRAVDERTSEGDGDPVDAAGNGSPRALGETLAGARQLFEACLSDVQPLTAGMARMAEEVRRGLDTIDALANGRASPLPNTPPLFDPLVRFLLSSNYQHAVKTAGREAANVELRAIVKELTHGRRGRPPRITVRQVQEAKRLRDTEKLSYTEIARRLGLDAKDGRSLWTAVRWHFPDEKKSR